MEHKILTLIKEIKTLSHPSNHYDKRDMILVLDNIYDIINIAFPEIEIDKEKIV